MKKKIIACITGLAIVAMIVPSSAQAVTAAELQAQITLLLETLTGLQAQLADLTGEPTGGITGCTITSFTRNLKVGMSGDDVKCLQIVLNTASDTQLSAGVGSPGQETSYFGPKTKAGVIKFQEKYASAILASWGLTSGTGYVGSTTLAKLNSLLAAGEQEEEEEEEEEEEPVVPGEGLSVALASDTPVATIVPLLSTNVEYAKINLTASSDGDVTVSQIIFTRKGVGSASNFENVYLYENDTRLTSGRTVSSQSQQAVFTNLGLKIEAGKTRKITLLAEQAGSSSGSINYFQIASSSDITSNASTVSGSFPIAGNTVTLGSQTAGTLEIGISGSPADPYVGSSQSEVTRFKLTAGAAEDVLVKRIILTNGGSIASTALTNFKLYRGSTLLAEADGMSNDRVSLTLTDDYTLLKGENRTFSVKADIAGRPTQTIKLYIDYDTDVYGIGKIYNGGVGVTNSFTSSTTSLPELTLQGGAVTVSMTGPAAGKIQTTAQDVPMMEYTITSTQDIEVRSTTLYICWDDTGSGTYNNITTTQRDDITDVKIINTETGGAVVGPTDGTGFTLTTAGDNICGTSVVGIYKTWSDYYDINDGSSLKLKVTLDLTAAEIAATDKIKVILKNFGASDIKSRVTNDYIAAADIVPSSNIAANEMTVQASGLTVALASTPVSDTYISKATGKQMVGFTMTAADASDIEINAIIVSAYVDATATHGTGGTSFTIDTDTTIVAKELVDNLYLYDGTTAVAGPKSIDSDGVITFSNMTLIIPAGGSKKLVLKGDISSNAPTDGSADHIKFDIADASGTDVTAYDSEGRTAAVAGDGVNGGRSGSADYTIVSINSAGSLYIVADADTPDSDIILMGAEDVTMAKIKFTTVDEGFTIKKIRLDNASTSYDDDIIKVTISYPNEADATVTQSGYLSGGYVDFSGMSMYIPQDKSRILTVLADINTLSGGADSGEKPKLSLSLDSIADDEFEATSDSGTTINDSAVYLDGTLNANTATDAITGMNDMYVRMTEPTITLNSSASGKLINGTNTLMKFTVEAAEGNDVSLKKISFDLSVDDIATSTALTLSAVKIYRSTDLTTERTATIEDGSGATTWNTGSGQSILVMLSAVNTAGEEVIPAGTSRQYQLKGTVGGAVSSSSGNDSITISLKTPDTTSGDRGITADLDMEPSADADALVEVDGESTSAISYFIWSDNSQGVNHSSGDVSGYDDWTNGYLVKSLPSDSVTLTY